jgi:Putative transmembrane protein (PGPGW)
MDDLFATVQQWIPVDVIIGLTVASVIGFIGSLIAIPLILVRLPADYFDMRTPRHWMKDHHPVLRLFGLFVKNVVGIVFLLAGIAMLFLPGQGLLTMLIGISLMDFPRKRELEAKLVGQPTLLGVINAMRHKFDKPPLILAPDSYSPHHADHRVQP